MEEFFFQLGNGEISISDEVTDQYVSQLVMQDQFWEEVASLLKREAHRLANLEDNLNLESLDSKLTKLLELTENIQQGISSGAIQVNPSKATVNPSNTTEDYIEEDEDEDDNDYLSLGSDLASGDLGDLLSNFSKFQ